MGTKFLKIFTRRSSTKSTKDPATTGKVLVFWNLIYICIDGLRWSVDWIWSTPVLAVYLQSTCKKNTCTNKVIYLPLSLFHTNSFYLYQAYYPTIPHQLWSQNKRNRKSYQNDNWKSRRRRIGRLPFPRVMVNKCSSWMEVGIM